MGLKEIFSRGKSASRETQWDHLVEDNGTQSAEIKRQQNLARQERKIVHAIYTGDVDGVIRRDDVELDHGEREAVLDFMTGDKFGRRQENYFLNGVATPVEINGAEAVMGQMVGDAWSLHLMSKINGDGKNWRQMESADVERLIGNFSSPADLESRIEDIINDADFDHSDNVVALRSAAERLTKTVYGKRQEYWEAMKDLKREAAEQVTEKDENYKMFMLGELSRERMLNSSRIEGDPFLIKGHEFKLSKEMIERAGLEPRYCVKFENATIGVSKHFSLQNGREAMLAYVDCDDGQDPVMRSFYRSGSQGVWRLMADYTSVEQTGDGIGWYGKGYSEECMILPNELQKSLTAISALEECDAGKLREALGQNVDNLSDEDVAEAFFAGTATRFNNHSEYFEALRSGQGRNSLYDELSSTPKAIITGSSDKMMVGSDGIERKQKVAPGELAVYGGWEPDFDAQTGEWIADSSIYGVMRMSCYKSADKQMSYTFCRDTEGHCWIGCAETNARVTSGGVRAEWVKTGDAGTPVYEYVKQDGGYGDYSDMKRGRYTNMWTNYLSKTPLVRRYVKYLSESE